MNHDHSIQVGVFQDYFAAEQAVSALLAAGYPGESISVICPECSAPAFPGVEKVEPAGSRAKSVVAGGSIGGVLGGLAATAGIVATGGIPLLIVGPLVAGAVVGGFVAAMTSRGFEPDIADVYDRALGAGQILVAVDTARAGEIPPREVARQLLAESGAETRVLPSGGTTH